MFGFLKNYTYAALFFGTFFFGELVVIPAVHASFLGKLDLRIIILFAVLTEAISDALWYAVGRRIPQHRLFRLPVLRRRADLAHTIEGFFKHRWRILLFLSKFIYGTRIIMQVFCGYYRIRIWRYLTMTVFAELVYTLSIVALVYFIEAGVSTIIGTVDTIRMSLLVIGLTYIALYLITHGLYILFYRTLK